jgi:hypothetical protein
MKKAAPMHKILFDNSGSMSELGKEQLLTNTLRFCRQYIELNNIKELVEYYQANNGIEHIKFEKNKDVVISTPTGRVSGNVISDWLQSNNNNFILWITDGYTNFSEELLLNLGKKSNLVIVALGCDADINQLKRFQSSLFLVDNLDAALEKFFIPISNMSVLPKVVEEAAIENVFSDDGSDDEW